MPSPYDTYTSPLATRNASGQMLRLWSARHKFNTWRRVWLAVAEAQHELGLPVSKEQVEELRAVVNRPGGITDAEIQAAEKYERDLRHDVMAHVHALGDSCPKAKGIIHLGMTSQDVVCNADIAIQRDAASIVRAKLARTVIDLATAAEKTKHTPTLGYTHYQPAQPVTVGRRCVLWANDLEFVNRHFAASNNGRLLFKGLRGATGTQASFHALAGKGDAELDSLEFKVLDGLESNFQDLSADVHQVVGQTYPRVQDAMLLADLAAAASVLHKIATDIRLLCNRKEIDEPFEDKQIGSSAMPYKRNPMRCERICGLTRFVMNLVGNAYDTAATQWLERTLDDSSNRRLSLPEAFLALDGALDLMHNVASGLIVHEATVRANLMAELPFMATENIMMEAVKLGGDRQQVHEAIRQHAQAAGLRVKDEGQPNDLIDRLRTEPLLRGVNLDKLMDPMLYIGRSVEQTERFIKEVVEPLRQQYGEAIAKLEESGPKV